jgi:hypothetical protein
MIAGVASSRCQSPRRYTIVTEGSFVKTKRPMRNAWGVCLFGTAGCGYRRVTLASLEHLVVPRSHTL